MWKYIITWTVFVVHNNVDFQSTEILDTIQREQSYTDRGKAFQFYDYASKQSTTNYFLDLKIDNVKIDSIYDNP